MIPTGTSQGAFPHRAQAIARAMEQGVQANLSPAQVTHTSRQTLMRYVYHPNEIME